MDIRSLMMILPLFSTVITIRLASVFLEQTGEILLPTAKDIIDMSTNGNWGVRLLGDPLAQKKAHQELLK